MTEPLNKEQLLQKRNAINRESGELKLLLKKAAVQFNETGRGMSREKYFKVSSRLDELKIQSQEIQLQISLASSKYKQQNRNNLEHTFMQLARAELPDEMFHSLLQKALVLNDIQKAS